MALIRGHHSFDSHFTQIPNEWLRDSRLSLKAIGLLAQLMSHAPGWQMSIRSLARANNCGLGAIKSAVEELEALGYLVRSKKQKHDESGKFMDFDWTTADPFQNPVTVKPRHGEMEHKEQQDSKEEKISKNNQETITAFADFWDVYPRKLDKGKAERAFRTALKKATANQIIAGAIRYRDDPNRKPDFTKYPATWLNAEAWENETATAGIEKWLSE